jgi:hypothetical protein
MGGGLRIMGTMSRTASVALLLFFATLPLSAQTAGDTGVKLTSEGRVPRHARVTYAIEVTKPESGDVAIEVDVPGDDVFAGGDCIGTKPLRCTVPGASRFLQVSTTLNDPGTFTATVRLLSVRDANPQNDQDSWTLEVLDQPSLTVWASGGRYEPGRTVPLPVSLYNGGAEAKDVVLTLTLPEGGTFTGRFEQGGEALTCAAAGGSMVCTLPSLANRAVLSFFVEVALPDRLEGGEVPFTASVASSVPDFDPADDHFTGAFTLIRYLVVTNTDDEGAGSLRQALLDAQQDCATMLCNVVFRIPGAGDGGRFVIQPRSELPELRGSVRLDGATQTAFGGDTNPDGPEIVLDGSLAPARGLLLGGPSCEMYVLELAIVNFSGPGIEARRGIYDYPRCPFFSFPNTVIARNHLSGNFRGVTVVGEGYATITDNVISGNRRAGIFTERSSYVEILRNRITGNGASGIFLHLDNPYALQGAVVEENVISGNAEWGIARALTGDARIRKNSIFGNRYLAIDSGLDLETPNRPEDPSAGGGVPNKPVLISAQYDPATNKTRVRGRLDSDTIFGLSAFTLDVYASASLSSAGQAEAEQWLAALALPANGGHTDFEMELEGDLRGRYITATNTRVHIVVEDHVFDTSEISNAVVAH